MFPETELANLAFMESLNGSVESNALQLIRVITISTEIPRGEEILVSRCAMHMHEAYNIQSETVAILGRSLGHCSMGPIL